MRYHTVVVRKILLISLLLALGRMVSWAQYDVSFAHYFDMEPSFNPGAIGKQSKLNITGAYAHDFAGFENNPRSMYIAGDMPVYFLKNYHGVGVQLMSDQIGLFTHQRLGLQYAYKHKLWGGTISGGLQLGASNEKFDGTKVDVEDSGDEALPTTDVSGTAIDIGFGLYYLHRRWFVGLSATHLTAPTVYLGDSYQFKIDRTYYLTGGYNIQLRNPFLQIKSSTLLRTDGSSFRADVTGRLVYTNEKKMMYGGVSYSPTNSVTFLLGGSFHGVVLGYSYELYTSGIGPGNGSHELFVGYQVDINLVKKGRNKHKSVRIL